MMSKSSSNRENNFVTDNKKKIFLTKRSKLFNHTNKKLFSVINFFFLTKSYKVFLILHSFFRRKSEANKKEVKQQ